ncbi:hypothetical protein ACP3S7_30890 [Phytobacter ursingii]
MNISRERLVQIASFSKSMALPPSHDEIEAMARALLAAYEQEPVEYATHVVDDGVGEFSDRMNFSLPVGTKLYTHPAPSIPAVPDYFAGLVSAARVRADKAMRKFPQPNYVLNKVAEEGGEVIKAVIHYTEGREAWANVEGELIDNLAMLIRLVTEGDQVIGFTPPESCRAAMLNGGNPSQDEYRNSLQELVKAMRDYEMDVGEPAPYKHRAMMKRAEALLNGGKS